MADNASTGSTGEGGTPPPAGAKPDPKQQQSTSSQTDDGFPADLGEAGRKALRAERDARAQAERERDALTAERDELKAKTQTEQEKALEDARKAGAAEANLAANRRIVKSELRAACAGKVTDPEDAVALLGDLDRFIVKGEPDLKAISSAIDDLVKAKPYLAAAGKAKPLPGGGATQSSGLSLNDDIRRKIRR